MNEAETAGGAQGYSREKEWARIRELLAAPFPAESIKWRVQGRANSQGKCQVLAYLDARDIQDRLDDVFGVLGWSFSWEPIAVEGGELKVAKGTISAFGASKSDVGDSSTFEGNKGAVSDCFKRAAVQWGVGRFLYDLPVPLVEVDSAGRILASERAALATRLQKHLDSKYPVKKITPQSVKS